MFDIGKHLVHWREGAIEDWRFSQRLIVRDKEPLYGLFFVHLSMEKALKAHVCKQTSKVPPRIHNLLVLARIASLALTPDQEKLFSELNLYNIRGRYPDMMAAKPSLEKAKEILTRSEEVFEWLIQQL